MRLSVRDNWSMPLSPLRQPQAPIQDAPRSISTPQQPAQHQHGLHRPAAATAAQRPSNPALRAAGGESGFDGKAPRPAGPQLSLPVAPGAPAPVQNGKPASLESATATGTTATTGTQAVGSVNSSGIDALFNKGSATFEKILGQLGASFQPIDDPTARLQSRSDQLGGMLAADPSLRNQVSPSDLAQVSALSKIFSDPAFYNGLTDPQKSAADSYNRTAAMLCADWPPPPDRK